MADDNQSYRDYGLISHYSLTNVDYRPTTNYTPDYWESTITSSLDISRVSAWLQVCEATHDHESRAKGHTLVRDIFPNLQSLRLVDVQNQCLVEMNLSFQYVALSYVWGNTPSIRLIKSNRLALLTPGSLKRIEWLIPPTIADAISLVEKLGLRYLWVDTLCLVQDEPEDFETGVNVMDRIYQEAWLTIVAACGHNADAGLPGVRNGTRRARAVNGVEVAPDTFLVPYTLLDPLMEETVYSSRGWT